MGLDVYLYKVDDYEKMRRLEAEGEERETAIWKEYGEYDDFTDAQKEQARARIAAMRNGLGLTGDYGGYPEEKIEVNSAAYPDHIFKIGYFRSSYNGGGINSFFDRIGLPDLYELFGVSRDEQDLTNWEAARPRVVDCIAAYKQKMEAGIIDCFDVSANMFSSGGEPENESDAIALYKKETAGEHSFDAWSSRAGVFYPKGIECVGFIPGIKYGSPCTFVMYKMRQDSMEYYLHALEIVLETIDYVLAQPDRDKFCYYLSWSG